MVQVQASTTIGTTTPNAMLHVRAGAVGTTVANIQGYSSGQTGDLLSVKKYETDTDNYFNIRSTGNVGVGTTSPTAMLHVINTTSTNATTTVEFGDQYSTGASGSKTCFNVKNNAGTAVSFYIVGTSIVVEANRCR